MVGLTEFTITLHRTPCSPVMDTVRTSAQRTRHWFQSSNVSLSTPRRPRLDTSTTSVSELFARVAMHYGMGRYVQQSVLVSAAKTLTEWEPELLMSAIEAPFGWEPGRHTHSLGAGTTVREGLQHCGEVTGE